MATTIFTFLSDQFQHEIKQKAEIGVTRFETVMKNYKKIFWDEFASLNHISNCSELNSRTEHLNSANKQNLQNWINCLQQTVSESSTSLKIFFDDLIDIYETYVRGNLTLASSKFNQLLSIHNLYNSTEDFERYYPITFRGRYSNSSINKITPDYFYHIPFDKLNLIKNYRFSLTGQPFIYLGASIPTVILELRANLINYANVELSAWGIKPNQRLKMYDISNALYDLINLNIIPIFNSDSGLTCQHTHVIPNITTFVTDFKKFIISQFCTFKKKDIENQIFIEQYVLPQLLTEQIRNYDVIKYDGFIFPSTQYLDRASSVENESYYGLFKNNIALFTHYSLADDYDNNLISKFKIIPIDKTKSMICEDYIAECEKIKHADVSKVLIKVKLELLNDYYSKMQLDKIVLTELSSIKLQLAIMHEYMKSL